MPYFPTGGRVRRTAARITSGDVVLPNTGGVWQALAPFTLAVDAAEGDYLELAWGALRSHVTTAHLDVAVDVGGTLVWYASSEGAAPAVEGIPDWYRDNGFIVHSAPVWLPVGASHVSGGQVTFKVAVASTAVAGTLYASAAYPFRWRCLNYGPVS